MSLNVSNIRTMLVNAKHKISIDENNLVFNTEANTRQTVNLLDRINIITKGGDTANRFILNAPQIPMGGGYIVVI